MWSQPCCQQAIDLHKARIQPGAGVLPHHVLRVEGQSGVTQTSQRGSLMRFQAKMVGSFLYTRPLMEFCR